MVLYFANDILAISLECLKNILNRARNYIKSQKKKVVSNFLLVNHLSQSTKKRQKSGGKTPKLAKKKKQKVPKSGKEPADAVETTETTSEVMSFLR